LFLDFLGVSKDSPRRKLQGVYSSERIPFGNEHALLLLLDVRYNRHPWDERHDPLADFLGEEQWTWLENEVRNSRASIFLVGSGITVLWDDWGGANENWSRFPEARRRLLTLLTGRKVIFLSGDIHLFEVRHMSPWNALEFTSSGLTHSWAEGNLNRLKEAINFAPVYGFASAVAAYTMFLAQKTLPHLYQDFYSLQRNFACLELDSSGVTIQAYQAVSGELLFERKYDNAQFHLAHNDTFPINSHVSIFRRPSVSWLFILAWLFFPLTALSALGFCIASCYCKKKRIQIKED